MRIIAGEFRGRRIEAPPGLATRPMLDRVREAVFSTLQRRLPDAVVLDLFAGSGSLGLEALSRGARHVRLVEQGAPALAALRKNVEALRARHRVEVVVGDALKATSWLPAADVRRYLPEVIMNLVEVIERVAQPDETRLEGGEVERFQRERLEELLGLPGCFDRRIIPNGFAY